MSKISIIIPILYRPEFHPIIEEIINHQTYTKEIELLIVEERWSYNKHNSPIKNAKYIFPETNENEILKIGTKLNLAHKHVKGDFILTMSSDDYYGPNYIEKMVDLVSNNKTSVSTEKMYLYNIINRQYSLLNTKGSYSAGLIYTRWVSTKYSFNQKKTRGEDRDFIKTLANNHPDMHLYTSKIINDILIIQHDNNISTKNQPHNKDHKIEFLKKFVTNKKCLDFYIDMGKYKYE